MPDTQNSFEQVHNPPTVRRPPIHRLFLHCRSLWQPPRAFFVVFLGSYGQASAPASTYFLLFAVSEYLYFIDAVGLVDTDSIRAGAEVESRECPPRHAWWLGLGAWIPGRVSVESHRDKRASSRPGHGVDYRAVRREHIAKNLKTPQGVLDVWYYMVNVWVLKCSTLCCVVNVVHPPGRGSVHPCTMY